MRSGLTGQTFYGHLNAVNDAAFSISGHLIASGDSDGILKLWDIRMVQEMMQLDTGDAIVHSVCFDKNSKLVACGCSDNQIKMVNLEKEEVSHVMKAHEDSVNGVIINQDNSTIYSIGSDGTLRTWK